MKIREFFTRFVAQATSLGSRRALPVRWRLAASSAFLTFSILAIFALIFATLTTSRLRTDFDVQVRDASKALQSQIQLGFNTSTGTLRYSGPQLDDFASAENAQIRIVTLDGEVIRSTKNAPNLGFPKTGLSDFNGYRVASEPLLLGSATGSVTVQYARPISQLNHTISRIRAILAIGVLSGALLALLAGLMIAQRAMAPVSELTLAARDIRLTRDPSKRIPTPTGNDEISELAVTLDQMLLALDQSHSELEAVLNQQRRFVADASHELRTPLTSILANLDLLKDHLAGEDKLSADAAHRSAQRMRWLVNDLLLLARNDSNPKTAFEPLDLAEVLQAAAAELEPVLDQHQLTLDAQPTPTNGVRDDIYRATLNLLQNAVKHTPAGTKIEAKSYLSDGKAVLQVSDNGPGIPPELENTLFERFTSSDSDRGNNTGLGLAIVKSVATAHGGGATAENLNPAGGAQLKFWLATS